MSETSRFSVAQVIEEIERELRGAPAAPAPTSSTGADLVRVRELQRHFRSDPVGGRLAPLKRAAYWLVASAFDRQGKVIEALLDQLEASEAARERLELRLAALEARRAAHSGERDPT